MALSRPRLEELRANVDAGTISWGETAELQEAFDEIPEAELPEPRENATLGDMLDELEARLPALVKTQRILDLEPVESPDEPVTFVQWSDDADTLTTVVTVSASTWQELGRPSKLTVTLEPGDLLNAPHQPEVTSTNTYIDKARL